MERKTMDQENILPSDQIAPADSVVEIVDLSAAPYQDLRRVKVNFRLSYFQEPPNAAISIFGEEEQELASADLVNIFQPDNEVTLHLPQSRSADGEYRVVLTLFDLVERQAEPGERGEVKLTTQNLTSKTVTFTLQ